MPNYIKDFHTSKHRAMAKEKLEDLSTEELEKKEKGLKVFIGIFVLLIIGLFYPVIRSFIIGEEVDWAIFTIAICTLGGPATLYPEWVKVRKALQSRGG
jgi:hypothetical protein